MAHEPDVTTSRESARAASPFASFWLAGFEGASHINGRGVRLDMVAATQHDLQADADYAALRDVGIRSVRESARWPLIDRGGRFDFASLVPMLNAARQHETQIVWTLCHYGWPDDIDLFSAAFVERFARYSGAVAEFIASHGDDAPIFAPMNEISFFAWAAGEVGEFYPYARDRGIELKRQLVRASLAACDAIWTSVPGARLLHIEPIINVVTPHDHPEAAGLAAAHTESQFEVWDMVAGRACPELGGRPHYLDLIGANFYHNNQWEYGGKRLRWSDEPRDARWVPLHRLLARVSARYGRPMILAETSHFGEGRCQWLRETADEVVLARAAGVPLDGVCLYPIIDRHDWEDSDHWHNCGLWDLVASDDGSLRRVLVSDYAAELARAQSAVDSADAKTPRRPRRTANLAPDE
jgi:beta-glucosidase/6-phospho-beta-glucosidase/beta-galactosidase